MYIMSDSESGYAKCSPYKGQDHQVQRMSCLAVAYGTASPRRKVSNANLDCRTGCFANQKR